MAQQTTTLVSAPNEVAWYRSKRWQMLILGACTYGTLYTGRQNFGVAATALRNELHLTSIQIGIASGSMLISYALGSLVSGYMADRFRARWLVSIGAVLSFLLNWRISFATDYTEVLVPWVFNGLVQAFGWVPCSRLITSWWPEEKRATIFGTILFSNGLSSVATYGLSLWSLDHFGWRFVFRLPVITILPAIAVFALFARQRSDCGATPIRSCASASISQTDPLSLVKNWRFLLFCGSFGCESVARYGLLLWVPIHLLGRDWQDTGQGKQLIMLLPLGRHGHRSFIHRIFSDKIFRKNRVYTIILEMLLSTVMVVGLSYAAKVSFWAFGTVLLLAGFNVYGPQAVTGQ